MSTEKRFESDPIGDFNRLPASSAAGATNSAGELKVELQDTSEVITVKGSLAVPEEVSFTRPSNTDAYTANDEISTKTLAETGAQPITFQAMTRTGDAGSGYIVNARLKKSQNSITNASFRLYLFTGIPTMSGDNEPFVMTHLAANYFGYIDFTFDVIGIQQAIGTFSGGGGPIGFYTPDGNIYGVLVARGAYTPASGEVFTPELTIDQN